MNKITDDYVITTFFVNPTKPMLLRFRYINYINTHEDIKLYLELRYNDSESYKETLYRIKLKIENKPLCKICGKPVHFSAISYHSDIPYFPDTCCSKCRYKLVRNKSISTLIDRYGDKNFNNREKCKQTCILKYGTSNIMNVSNIKDKIIQTNLKRYGVKWSALNKDINRKTILTQIKKYGGVFNPLKVKETNLYLYGVEKPFQSLVILNKIDRNSEITKIKRNNTKRKNHTLNTSKPEDNIYNMLVLKYPNIIRLYTSALYPYNCDFYIPELDLYIECNFHWTHGKHPFNDNNLDDLNLLSIWKQRSTYSNFYKTAIDVWTNRDIIKRDTAYKNKLNYLELWVEDDIYKTDLI